MVSKWLLIGGAVAATVVAGAAVAYARQPPPETRYVPTDGEVVKGLGYEAPPPPPPIEQVVPPPKPTVADATVVDVGGGQTALVTSSTLFVEVTGTDLPPTQTLQAAAQITGQPVISSTSVAGLTGGADYTTITAKDNTDLSRALNQALVVKKEDNKVYASGVIGYASNGDPIFGLTLQQNLDLIVQVNGYWYRSDYTRHGLYKYFLGVVIIDRNGNVSYPPAIPDLYVG